MIFYLIRGPPWHIMAHILTTHHKPKVSQISKLVDHMSQFSNKLQNVGHWLLRSCGLAGAAPPTAIQLQ